MIVTLTRGQLKDIIKEAIAENAQPAAKKDEQDGYISITEATKVFSPPISKWTLHRWKKLGLVPSHRFGGRIYYKRSEILAAADKLKKFDRNKIAPEA